MSKFIKKIDCYSETFLGAKKSFIEISKYKDLRGNDILRLKTDKGFIELTKEQAITLIDTLNNTLK